MALGSSRPYLVRALFDWIVDGGEAPYLVVDATYPYVEVPEGYVEDGQIVLNASPDAVVALSMDEHALSFQARFGGQPQRVYLPYGAINAIYGRDSGLGMGFGQEPGGAPELPGEAPQIVSIEPEASDEDEAPTPPKKGKPALRIVKSDD